MESHLTINDVVRRTGLTAHTLRYYERAGLIAPVARAAGGQRRYAAADMEWIGFLLRLRETRMPIGQMQAFARLRGEGDATVPQRRAMLQAHLNDVQAAIAAMQQSAQVLQAKIAHYRAVEVSLDTASTPDESPLHAPPHTLRTRAGQTPRNRR
ncbi:MerR family transcriptional regulator [Acidovorax sp. sif1233]|uniref:MerR family transcriptional regulator n=1 Tax=Acidovorax sp. sif1233 TaxID=2854792 RepID=UPI001C454173|nr:MerR family transcriptional regulator [Acidovorax sp. sif1233]MBV7453774.1 MerR family transcriptional regulator [Acidovorax sp. sif1233]